MHPCMLLYVPIKWDQVTVHYCTDVCVRRGQPTERNKYVCRILSRLSAAKPPICRIGVSGFIVFVAPPYRHHRHRLHGSVARKHLDYLLTELSLTQK